jgi:hypothetical protein
VAAADVLAALPGSRFDKCFKDALSAGGSGLSGGGILHLDINASGGTKAACAVPAQLQSVGQCIADAANGRVVKHVDSGATGADIDLTFQPE